MVSKGQFVGLDWNRAATLTYALLEPHRAATLTYALLNSPGTLFLSQSVAYLVNDTCTLFLRQKFSDLYTLPQTNCSKTLPFTVAHTYIPYVWEYHPLPPSPLQ